MIKKSPKAKPVIAQQRPEDVPAGWDNVQEQLAASSGLSVLLVEGHQPPALVASNNNSICNAFQSSPEHVSLCDPYCGDAHRVAMSAGGVVPYKCHAGLQCFTMPVEIADERNLAVIGGRAFVTGDDYRTIVERFRVGDLTELLAKNPFENVIFAEQPRLERLVEGLQKAESDFKRKSSAKPATRKAAAPTEPATSSSNLQREIERLRAELDYRSRFAESLRYFLDRISSTDPQKTYAAILTNSRELLLAERASLLVIDEAANGLVLKASAGFPKGVSEVRIRLGEGIAGSVLQTGKPLVVENIRSGEFHPAAAEREYKTNSFISYPIVIGGRTIGVLNVTDKAGGENYDEVDLSLLEIIGPQVALALERSEWQERAKEFELMSITDPLTGLLNRRYLEERLTEELNRSRRYDYPMSFLMIDIDDFKTYNDLNGHPAGDLAIQMTARCLKGDLRAADVACRYGGEEFGILLPQTPRSEAGAIAERMRQRVANTAYPHGTSQPLGRVTISLGVATVGKNVDTADRVISAADRALYKAKSLGKNRIEFYHDN